MKNNLDRRNREKAEMKLRILDAARELFLSGGEEAVTLRRVAERIEYSATTIYLHFPNKEALIEEICTADFAVYSRKMQQAERTPDPVSRLRKIAAAYVDFGLLHPAHYRAMFMTVAGVTSATPDQQKGLPSPSHSHPAEPRGATTSPVNPYEFLHRAVFKAMAAGCLNPTYRDVALITQVIWSGLHGVISLRLVRSRYAAVAWRPVQAGADMMVECLIKGLTIEGDPGPG